MSVKFPYSPGLEGVIAGKTSICKVDEEKGELLYRGYPIGELFESSTFEEVAYLLLMGELPQRMDLDAFSERLVAERDIPEAVTDVLSILPEEAHPMDALKIAIGVLGTMDPDASSNTKDANLRKAIRLIAKLPTIITSHYRISKGMRPLKPNKDISHAANFLYIMKHSCLKETQRAMKIIPLHPPLVKGGWGDFQVKGKEPEDYESRILDRSFILYAEHEYNASAFASRVTASTLSDMHSSIASAIGTLKGPLHGGANERVMEMLLDIGKPEKVEPWIKDALSKKKRIMGFGHRVYKKEDPRVYFIKRMAMELSDKLGERKWFDISQRIEDVMKREKGLHPNLDFYSAIAYYLLSIPIPLYTPVFAAARVAGWAAHVMEQHADNRLIRPRGEYIGPERKKLIALEDRGHACGK